MANELDPSGLPQSEAEVIARLKNKPDEIDVQARVSDESPRHWVNINYEFKGKLTAFGKFLATIAGDVWQAGGVVVEIDFPIACGMTPSNKDYHDKRPEGVWHCTSVKFRIKTRAEVEANAAAWVETIKDIAQRHGGK